MSVRRRKVKAKVERRENQQRMKAEFDVGLRGAVKAAVQTVMDRPGPPHPLDNEWRIFGNYYKLHYDVADLLTGEVLHEAVWPNAGKIAGFEAGECQVRISHLHPFSKTLQLDAQTIAMTERSYGKWQPAQGDDRP